MWTQIIGKIRLAQAPLINHWWQVPLYVTSRGLTTSPIPYGERVFEIGFDFIDHRLTIETSDGEADGFALRPIAVADFYARGHAAAAGARASTSRSGRRRSKSPTRSRSNRTAPTPPTIPITPTASGACLVQADRVFTAFRARFLGKASPVHFFWGSFDLAVTRFSGRRAPQHPGAPNVADQVTREAYSHEVSSCGFWPGGAGMEQPIFYSYAYPQPAGFGDAPVAPARRFLQPRLRRIHPALRRGSPGRGPDEALLDFLQSTYEAAATLAHWDRAALERPRGAVNLFAPLPDARAAEVVDTLLSRPGIRIERIVSLGQASPPGFWYDQDEGEWVVLLAGAARLRFADESRSPRSRSRRLPRHRAAPPPPRRLDRPGDADPLARNILSLSTVVSPAARL